MADVVSRAVRSRMMSGIRGKHTKPERLVRSYLHKRGYRFSLHSKLAGRPDLTLARHGVVLFVHGCFWHGHAGCRYFRLPTTNAAFWKAKIGGNRKRDLAAIHSLMKEGWRVGIVWECSLRKDPDKTLQAVARFIRKDTRLGKF